MVASRIVAKGQTPKEGIGQRSDRSCAWTPSVKCLRRRWRARHSSSLSAFYEESWAGCWAERRLTRSLPCSSLSSRPGVTSCLISFLAWDFLNLTHVHWNYAPKKKSDLVSMIVELVWPLLLQNSLNYFRQVPHFFQLRQLFQFA